MTLQTTTNIAKLFPDGIVTEFPFSFRVTAADHLMVLLRDLTGAVVRTYAQNEISISGLGGNAGTVTITPPPADDHELLIVRVVPFSQDTDIVNQGGFFPEVIEAQLDNIVMQTQQLDERLDRAIVSDIGDPAYQLGRLDENDFIQFQAGKLEGVTIAEFTAPINDILAEAEGYVAALFTYTFGYIGIDDDSVPADVAEGEGFIYTMAGRVFGALNTGGVADVQFELFTKALADTGGAGAGTVTSVAASGGTTGLAFSGSPVTSAGTLTLGGILGVANGGTGGETAAAARANLSAAASGANADITSLRQSTAIASTGVISPSSIGFRGVPRSVQAQGSTITAGLDDASRVMLNTTGGWVIPANAGTPFPLDTVLIGYNNSAATQTVSITSDTLRHEGSATTGARVITQRSFWRAIKVAATEWVIA